MNNACGITGVPAVVGLNLIEAPSISMSGRRDPIGIPLARPAMQLAPVAGYVRNAINASTMATGLCSATQ